MFPFSTCNKRLELNHLQLTPTFLASDRSVRSDALCSVRSKARVAPFVASLLPLSWAQNLSSPRFVPSPQCSRRDGAHSTCPSKVKDIKFTMAAELIRSITSAPSGSRSTSKGTGTQPGLGWLPSSHLPITSGPTISRSPTSMFHGHIALAPQTRLCLRRVPLRAKKGPSSQIAPPLKKTNQKASEVTGFSSLLVNTSLLWGSQVQLLLTGPICVLTPQIIQVPLDTT